MANLTEALWTVCSNLESIIKKDGADYPQSFHTNLDEAFEMLAELKELQRQAGAYEG